MKIMVALNAYENDGSVMPMEMMALNTYGNGGGSERL